MSEFDLLQYAKDHSQKLTREVNLPGGGVVTLRYQNRQATLAQLNKVQALTGPQEKQEAEAERLGEEFLAGAVESWREMTPEAVAHLFEADPDGLPDDLPCTKNNIIALLRKSSIFYGAVNNGATNLLAFRLWAKEQAEKNSPGSPAGPTPTGEPNAGTA